jgi:hypothetical protein
VAADPAQQTHHSSAADNLAGAVPPISVVEDQSTDEAHRSPEDINTDRHSAVAQGERPTGRPLGARVLVKN